MRAVGDFNRLHGDKLVGLPGVRQTRSFFVMKEVVDNAPSEFCSDLAPPCDVQGDHDCNASALGLSHARAILRGNGRNALDQNESNAGNDNSAAEYRHGCQTFTEDEDTAQHGKDR